MAMSPSTGPWCVASLVSAIRPAHCARHCDGSYAGRTWARTTAALRPASRRPPTPPPTRGTLASNIWVGDHHIHRSAARCETSSRIAATSRVDRIESGSTNPTRPPGRASRTASAKNSAALSAYGPPPNSRSATTRCRGGQLVEERWVADHSIEPLVAPILRQRVAVRPRRRRIDVDSGAIRQLLRTASRKRPSPHAGSSTVDGVKSRNISDTTASTNSGGVYQAPSSFRCDTGIARA